MVTEEIDTIFLQKEDAIKNGPLIVFRLPVRNSASEISVALIYLDGINRRVRNPESEARYFCVAGKVSFLVWQNGEHTLHELFPGDFVKIPPGSPYQDFGKGQMISINKPAFNPDKMEVLDQYGNLPEFSPGKVVRETTNYQVVTDWKPGRENDPKGQRFYVLPKTTTAEHMLQLAANLHNVHNFVARSVVIDEISTSRQALRADFIKENVPSLFYGKTEIPSDGEDSIPSPDRLEECLRDHKDSYTF